MYFWLLSVLVAWGLSLVAGNTLRYRARASRFSGFSCCKAWAPAVVSQGLQLLHSVWNPPRPEIKPCPLHRQVDSCPLDHQGSPHCWPSKEPNFGSIDFLSCFFLSSISFNSNLAFVISLLLLVLGFFFSLLCNFLSCKAKLLIWDLSFFKKYRCFICDVHFDPPEQVIVWFHCCRVTDLLLVSNNLWGDTP